MKPSVIPSPLFFAGLSIALLGGGICVYTNSGVAIVAGIVLTALGFFVIDRAVKIDRRDKLHR